MRNLLIVVSITAALLSGCGAVENIDVQKTAEVASDVAGIAVEKAAETLGYLKEAGQGTEVTDFKALPSPESGYSLTLNEKINFVCKLDKATGTVNLNAAAPDEEKYYAGIADLLVGKNEKYLSKQSVIDLLKSKGLSNELNGKLVLMFPYSLKVVKENGTVNAGMSITLNP